jgi:cytochrome c-type biogenesis protein CcmE
MPRLPLRIVVPAVVLVAAAGWGVAATQGLKRGAVYYYTPSELGERAPRSEVIRVGGRVRPGSVRWDGDAGVLRFVLTDGKAGIPVRNTGAPPSLFRDGAGAVVEGRLASGVLRSSEVIVKHDENYRPPDS